MVSWIEKHREALEELCRRTKVSRLELYGSGNDPAQFNPTTSDVDFLVEFLPLPEGGHADAYFDLLEGIQDLFEIPVDLVMTAAIRNPYFVEGIGDDREVIYAA